MDTEIQNKVSRHSNAIKTFNFFFKLETGLFLVYAQLDQELPEKTKYFFSSREVLNFGTFARISDHFNVENANDWMLNSAFWAYPKEYPGTVVSR